MSLDYRVSKVKNHEELCWTTDERGRRDLSVVTKALVFHTLAIGMGEITEENVAEFASRIALVELLYGSSVKVQDEEAGEWSDRPITREDVEAHIGLWTNVFPETPRPSWLNRTFEVRYQGVPHISMPGDWDYEDDLDDEEDGGW